MNNKQRFPKLVGSVPRREFLSLSAATCAATVAGVSTGTAFGENQPHWTDQEDQQEGTRFAVNVEMWFRGTPFLDRIRASKDLGFNAVEFWPFGNKDIDAIAKLAGELEMDVAQFTAWGFSPGMNNPKNEDQFAAQIEEACAVAKRLNCKMMTVVAGNNQKEMNQQQMLSQVTKSLQRVVPVLEKNEIMAILEPMNPRDHAGHCLYGSKDAVEICRKVDSPMVKINWDLYHMQKVEGDLCVNMREGFDQIGYLQLADTPGRNEPGTGEVNYARVLREAWDLGYRGYVGLECRPKEDEATAAKRVRENDWKSE